jgi:hypothetical protein
MGLQPTRDGDQKSIGRQRSQAVVHRAESIQTEDEEGARIVRASLLAPDGLFQQLDQEHAIGESCQRVGHLAVGHIGQGAGEASGDAGCVPDRGAAAPYPAVGLIAMKQAVLALIVAADPREMRVERLLDASDVVSMHPCQPFVEARADLRRPVPQHRFPPRRPVDLARRQVPVPEPVVRAPHREGVAFLALAQAFHGPFVGHVGLDPREGDGEIDRFGDVVVGAETQGFGDVGAIRSGRHHDDRQVDPGVGLAKPCEDVEPAHAGHFDVEQNEVEGAARRERQSLLAVRRELDVVTLLPQAARQRVSIQLVVVDNEQ